MNKLTKEEVVLLLAKLSNSVGEAIEISDCEVNIIAEMQFGQKNVTSIIDEPEIDEWTGERFSGWRSLNLKIRWKK